MSSVRRMQENRNVARQKQEDFVVATNKRLTTDRTLAGNYRSDERVDIMRRTRQGKEVDNELDMQRRVEEDETRKERFKQQQELEESQQREEEERTREQLLDEKTRQRIRSESDELKDLEHKLKVAYMNKERAAQLEEQRILKAKQQTQDKLYSKEEEAYRKHIDQMESERESRRKEERYTIKQDLEFQMKSKDEKNRKEYENFLKEKLMIDEIVRKIHEEDQSEMMDRMKKQHETREYISNYLSDRESWKQEEERKRVEENNKINEYVVQKKERDDQTAALKKIRQEEKDRIFERLSEHVGSQRRKQEELEQMRIELHMEEEAEKQRLKGKELLERRIQQRMDLLRTNEELQRIRAEINRKHQDEEEAYGRKVMEEMANQDRLDQMNAQKARMKKLEHRHEVERILEERRLTFENERRAQIEEYILAQQREEARRAIIEEERQRLLREHAVNLFGYLPKDIERELGDLGNNSSSPQTPTNNNNYNNNSQPQSRNLSPAFNNSNNSAKGRSTDSARRLR